MDYFPIFVDLRHRPVLVVGGGKVALRKIELLLSCQAEIKVVAKELHPLLQPYLKEQKISWLDTDFNEQYLQQMVLVVAATDDIILNHQIYQSAVEQRIWVNCVDEPQHCSFIFPSIVDRSPLVIAISSAGYAPILSRILRQKLEQLLPRSLSMLARQIGDWRQKLKQILHDVDERRIFWLKLFRRHEQALLASTQPQQVNQLISAQLKAKKAAEVTIGNVILVGAGPSDAELLTIKALRALQTADVVLYDALIGEDILQLLPKETEKVYVGKRAWQHNIRQQEINQLMIDYARQGKRVVRLKGGDPFIFGRGGEELQVLAEHGIPFQVIPGISAAIGAAAYSGIPLTHRQLSHSVTFITGYHQQRNRQTDWALLAQSHHTLVIYMGMLQSVEIVKHLLKNGRAAETPVAIVSRATSAEQQVFCSTLSELAQLTETPVKPALIIIGEVVELHSTLAWFNVATVPESLTKELHEA